MPFHSGPKSDMQRVIDIFLQGPKILHKADQVSQIPQESMLSFILSIADDLWAMDQRLQEFEQELQGPTSRHSLPLYWEQPSRVRPIVADEEDELFKQRSVAVHFASVPNACVITFVWAIQALIWSGLGDIYEGIVSMGASSLIGTRLPKLHHRARWIEPIWKICQSIEYWQSPSALALGPIRSALQFNIVIDVVKTRKGMEATSRWAKECREAIGQGWLRILRYSENNDSAP